MKIKLLKKIRKRFRIVHYPNGIPFNSDGNWLVLYDRDQSHNDIYRLVTEVDTEKEVYDELFLKLIQYVLRDYHRYGIRRLKKRNEILLWHVGKK